MLFLKPRLLAVILLPIVATACAQMDSPKREVPSRAQVVENLGPIVAMEKKGAQLTVVMQHLPMLVNISPEDARVLKEHYDVYFIYHNAAATSLAEGNLKAYQDLVRVGSDELDSLEAKLKGVVEKSPLGQHGNSASPGEMQNELVP